MSRIKRLENDELTYLRTQIRAVFANHYPKEQLPPQNAYLPNYQDIKRDINHRIPEAQSSISENRLRKLFYYTDPEMVPEWTLQAPNFGIDFLDACYRYISNNQYGREEFRKHIPGTKHIGNTERPWWKVALILVPIAVGGWLLTSKMRPVEKQVLPIREGFDLVDLDELGSRGWSVLDPDSSWLQKQERRGYFTFYTLPGSYWTKPQEPISVPNTLIHKLPEGAAGVRACFADFLPNQNWQSIGMILLNENLDREDLICMSFGYASSLDSVGSSPYVLSATRFRRGIPDMPFFTKLVQKPDDRGHKIRLDFGWTSDEIGCYAGVNETNHFSQEWDPFMLFGNLDKPFEPAYVGFFCCQGWTNDAHEPLQADIIPAILDWVEIY